MVGLKRRPRCLRRTHLAMNSCLYEIKIMHERRAPKHYRFEHAIFMFYLDLDELDQVSRRTGLFGHNQPRLYNFREADHIGNVRDYLRKQGVNDQVQRITFLTNLRSFGYIFNPVSFYFCFDANGQPVCVVPEIGNTFGELKYFYLGPEKRAQQTFNDRQTKYYYVSPFTDLDNVMDFEIQVPDDQLKIGIDVLKNGQRFFYSSMLGRRQELTTANVLKYTLRFPFVTLKVIFLIHWHAAVLHFTKKLPYQNKESNPDLQRDVSLPAHHS